LLRLASARAYGANCFDPGKEEGRLRKAAIEAERTKQASTLGAAFEAYVVRKASRLKSGRVIQNEMRREFADWMERQLADISPADVKEMIGAIARRGHETQAHVLFGMLRTFMNWCIDSGDFGLEASPCARIKPSVLIGSRNVCSRTLKDFELAAYWHAAEEMGYPFGKLFQLLALTATRQRACCAVNG
jgi:hypothetical protein